ncbi:MAG: hypothetical protein Q9227_000210 [Pyrenula ochraceoflavens]
MSMDDRLTTQELDVNTSQKDYNAQKVLLACGTRYLETLYGMPKAYQDYCRETSTKFVKPLGLPPLIKTLSIPSRLMASGSSKIIDLPNEILLMVLEELDWLSIYNLLRVNSHLYNQISPEALERAKPRIIQRLPLEDLNQRFTCKCDFPCIAEHQHLRCYTCLHVLPDLFFDRGYRTPTGDLTHDGFRRCYACEFRRNFPNWESTQIGQLTIGGRDPRDPFREVEPEISFHPVCGRLIFKRPWHPPPSQSCHDCCNIVRRRNIMRINWLKERQLVDLAMPWAQPQLLANDMTEEQQLAWIAKGCQLPSLVRSCKFC